MHTVFTIFILLFILQHQKIGYRLDTVDPLLNEALAGAHGAPRSQIIHWHVNAIYCILFCILLYVLYCI